MTNEPKNEHVRLVLPNDASVEIMGTTIRVSPGTDRVLRDAVLEYGRLKYDEGRDQARQRIYAAIDKSRMLAVSGDMICAYVRALNIVDAPPPATKPCPDCGNATAEDGVCEEVACDKPGKPVTRAAIVDGNLLRLASTRTGNGECRWANIPHESKWQARDDINATIDNAVDAALREASEVAKRVSVEHIRGIGEMKSAIVEAIDKLRKTKRETTK